MILLRLGHPCNYEQTKTVQTEMKRRGLYAGVIDGVYGVMTEAAIRKFQERCGLNDDGVVGPITWGRMFQNEAADEALIRSNPPVDIKQAMGVEAVIAVAERYLGLREIGTTNRGPKLDEWARALKKPMGIFWCLSYVQGCFAEAAKAIGCEDPLKPDTAGCIDLWNRVPDSWRHGVQDGRRGDIGILAFNGGAGHCWITRGYGAGIYDTIEGNTNDDGSRNGVEVCYRTRKYNDPKLKGFIRVPWVC